MAGEKYQFEFSDGGSLDRLAAKLNEFVAKIRQQQQLLTERGGSSEQLDQFAQQFDATIRASMQRIDAFERRLRELRDELNQINREDPHGNLPSRNERRAEISNAEEQAKLGILQEQKNIRDALAAGERQAADALERDLRNQTALTRQLLEQDKLQQRAKQATSRDALGETVERRRNALIERRAQLIEQITEQQARVEAGTPRNVGTKQFENILRLQDQIVAKERERNLLAEQERRTRAKIAELDLQQNKRVGPLSPAEQEALDKARLAAASELNRIRERDVTLQRELTTAENQRVQALQKIAAIERDAGSVGSVEMLERLLAVTRQLTQLDTEGVDALAGLAGVSDIREEFQRIQQQILRIQDSDIVEEEKVAQVQVLNQRMRELLGTVEKLGRGEGIPDLFATDDLFAGLPTFERTVIGAFEGLGQRFRATLQFALSGSLLFQAQRLAREFIQAAIEVERTFEDIKTAFEFDIISVNPAAGRGTFAFDQQVEGIRRRLVDIADQYQALPSFVNEAAYEMVARFRDVEAAEIAVRAQVLATKVSTIDQAEALSALTAVAESYGQTLDRNLNREQRQLAQAKLYMQALDGAVALQEQFGIAVEETIEGTAGLAELAALQGFSLAQTQAALGLVIDRTNTSGATAADGIGRVIGQLTSPEVKAQLLELAAGVEEFRLTTLDFADGESVLRRVNEELLRIQDFDPQLATDLQGKLVEIIGQRREARFAAPLIGTSELQAAAIRAIDESAGEAERRFGFLARTTEELLASIIGQFQELAQNLQQIGLLTPLRGLLISVDGLLNGVNELLKVFGTLFGFLDRFRVGNVGIGDLITKLLSGVLAVTALKRALDAAHLSLQVLAGTKLAGLFGTVARAGAAPASAAAIASGATVAKGAAATVGTVGVASYMRNLAEADKQLLTFGRTLAAFFINPFGTIRTVLEGAAGSIVRFRDTLRSQSAVSVAAGQTLRQAEHNLTIERLRASAVNRSVANTTLVATRAVGTFALGLLRFALQAGAIYLAIQALTILGQTLADLPNQIRGTEDTVRRRVDQRATEIQRESAESGVGLSDSEAAIEALKEEFEFYEDRLEDVRGFWGSVVASFVRKPFGAFDNPLADQSLRTEEGVLGAEAFAQLEFIQLRLRQFGEELGSLETDRNTLDPSAAKNLDDALGQYEALVQAIGAIAASDPDFSNPQTQKLLESLYDDLLRLGVLVGEDLTNVARGVEGFRTVIQASLRRIQQSLQLGDISPAQAEDEIRGLIAEAEALLAQETDTKEREEYVNIILDARTQLQSILESNIAWMTQVLTASGGSDLQQAAAALEAARRALELSEAEYDQNSRALQQRRLEVIQAERRFADAVAAEARARLQIQADSAKTFADQIDALKALERAIAAEVVQREGTVAYVTGAAELTVDEVQQLISLEDQITAIRLRAAQLRAKLSITERASTLDNIASIAANIAALQAEIQFMRADGAEELLIREKLQELRQQQGELLLAEAQRRASFFQLTAGVGDEVASAQATLRTALDRLQTITDLGGRETEEGYAQQLEVLRAREALVQLSLRQADLERRIASDLSDSLAQAFLDVQEAQQALATATGPLEQLEAQQALAQAELGAQREFYDRRLSDLDFLFRTDQIGQSQYISALRTTQSQIDRTTRQGEELWRQIELEIRGLADSAANLAFNIPTEIQLPTLFEVRRALAADALGVNYMDNRQQDINVFVSDNISLADVVAAIEDRFGGSIDVEASRLATGGAGITIGGFT